MPKRKHQQREHTEDWQTIQQYTLWPEQTAYELLRPVVLFGDPAIQQAKETDEPRASLERKADALALPHSREIAPRCTSATATRRPVRMHGW